MVSELGAVPLVELSCSQALPFARDAVHDNDPSPIFVMSTVSSCLAVLPKAAESVTCPMEALRLPIGGGVTSSSSLHVDNRSPIHRTSKPVPSWRIPGPSKPRRIDRRILAALNTQPRLVAALLGLPLTSNPGLFSPASEYFSSSF